MTTHPSRPTRHRLLTRFLVVPLALAVVTASCGGSGSDADSPPGAPDTVLEATTGDTEATTGTEATTDTGATTAEAGAVLDADAPELGRVVALAEEFVLADLLALGVTPVASTATVDAAGFLGLDQFDTSDIEVLPQTTLSLEYLASLRPDTIVTLQFWVDQIGADVLSGIAEVMVIPDGLSGSDQVEFLGGMLGRPEHAAVVVDELTDAATAARAAVGEGCALSLATVYPGPTVAAFVDGPWQMPSAIQSAGCEIVPGPDVVEPDANGRAWLSEEQLGLLDQDVLVLMQNESVEGESNSLAEIQASALWATLPAVRSDNVVVVDRLGYPGAPGLIRFYRDLPSIVEPS
jgi:ABC-type Fe3+-hydroxamate transport system substrate-binding protein